MKKCFNKQTESLVKLHLHKNEVVPGSLQPLMWRSLRQQSMAPIPWLLSLGVGGWYCLFLLLLSLLLIFMCVYVRACVCVCVVCVLCVCSVCVRALTTADLIIDLCSCYSFCCFWMFFCMCVIGKKIIKQNQKNTLMLNCYLMTQTVLLMK